MNQDNGAMLQIATDFVNSGNYSEALEQARGVLVVDPSNGDAKLIEAISLSQMKNSRDASEAFAAAIAMIPTSAKARFNAAVHEFNAGNVGQARILANEAFSLDPSHEGTKTLLNQMGPEQPFYQGGASYPREGLQGFEPAYEGIAMVKSMGKAWVFFGWTLALLSAASFAYSLIGVLSHLSEIMSAVNSNDRAKINNIANTLQNPFMQILGYALVAANMVWTIMDLIHRKGNFIWLIPHIPCTCIGLSFITQPIYILFGRK